MNKFDTQPLLNEINSIINNGVQEIVKDFMKRHTLLEETHDKLVNLPSVKQYYNSIPSHISNAQTVTYLPTETHSHASVSNIQSCDEDETVKQKISDLDDKINNIWKIYGDHFVKLSSQLDELKCEIAGLKSVSSSKIEKENIKLEIVDDIAVNECKVEEEEEAEEEEVEEEEVQEEEVEEEEAEEEVEEEEVEEEEAEEEEVAEEVASVETETKEITADEEEDDEELFEIEIDDVTYCTNNEENGDIYELDKDGNVGKKVGYLKEGDAYFE